jgi:hypothetical protein
MQRLLLKRRVVMSVQVERWVVPRASPCRAWAHGLTARQEEAIADKRPLLTRRSCSDSFVCSTVFGLLGYLDTKRGLNLCLCTMCNQAAINGDPALCQHMGLHDRLGCFCRFNRKTLQERLEYERQFTFGFLFLFNQARPPCRVD